MLDGGNHTLPPDQALYGEQECVVLVQEQGAYIRDITNPSTSHANRSTPTYANTLHIQYIDKHSTH